MLPLSRFARAPAGWWWLLPLPLLAWVFWPALSAGFSGDDWTILALARHGGPAWAYYVEDHTLAYSYRPHGMLSWWLAAQAFGAWAPGHYAVALAIHAANAVLLARLVRRSGAPLLAAALAAALFAVHPAAIATAVWLSDRYDLLAMTGVLGTLLALQSALRRPRGGLWPLALCAALAAGSKETAFAVAAAGAVWLGLAATLPLRRRLALAAALLAPFALALALRLLVFGGSGLARLGRLAGGPLEHLDGVLRWLQHLPEVLFATPHAWAGGLVLAVLAVLLHRSPRTVRVPCAPLCAALVLLLAPALLQAPITRLALAGDAPFASLTNARFYYLALGAFLWALTLLLPRPASKDRESSAARWRPRAGLAVLLVVAVLAAFAVRSKALALRWQAFTAAEPLARLNAAAAAAVEAAALAGPPCRVDLLAAGESPDLPRFADSLVKAQLPPQSPALDCVVGGEQPSWVVLTRTALPPAAAPAPRIAGDPLYAPRPVLQLVAYFPAGPSAAAPPARALRWNGSRFAADR